MGRIRNFPFAKQIVAFQEIEPTEEEALEFPEDLSALSGEDITALRDRAIEAFETMYGDGSELSEGDLEALAALTEGIEALSAEQAVREEAAAQRAEQAEALAARVRPELAAESAEESADEDEDEESEDDEDEAKSEDTEENASETVTASAGKSKAKGPLRVNLSNIRSRRPAALPASQSAETGMKDIVFAASDSGGVPAGTGLDWDGIGNALDRRLAGFNQQSYSKAAFAGRSMREQHGLAVIKRDYPPELMVGDSQSQVEAALKFAVDQSRLPQGSLVASGGWCAPSETLYDFMEVETASGLISLPEIGISRGGVNHTLGIDYSDIYANTGFNYTEQEDIDGDYDGEGGGSKPCYEVECPTFEEVRLETAGLCITSGLLQQRGYPEILARTVRGALIAHRHKMAGRFISAIVDDSDAVSLPTPQVGATAPILTALELQVTHYRYVNRLSDTATLEAVFPFWVRGAIRSDLSRRLGVDLLSVTDAQINSWFAERGVSAQFVYNWQDLTGAASAFTAWPTEVKFLLYTAGTWVRGGSDVITLDTIYDSVNLGTNDFTALFTEEGWLMLKRFKDSRVVTVPLSTDGATHAGVLIEHNGTLTPATD